MERMNRRELLRHGAVGLLLAPLALTATRVDARARFRRDPFTLGVASGYPAPDSVVLWSRLAPEPLSPDGGMGPQTVPVTWELAADEQFRDVVRSGTAYAEPAWGHSIHVEPQGLEPGRRYWYRFTAGDARSPVGRTWTAPGDGSQLDHLRLAVASCQQYEHGYYTAYQHMLQDDPDLIVHLGDYIYELSWGEQRVRSHNAGECYSLGDYRVRHALYRSDPDLQAAHAACPWLLTWDDHEVDNDYGGDSSEQDDDPQWMRARRAAAYQAYYEHLPLPRRALPFGADLRLYTQRSFGDLASVYLLDERQYRAPQACPIPGARGGHRVRVKDCPELLDESRSMLGTRQEAWLGARLQQAAARWNLLAQGVPMMHADEDPDHGGLYWTDSWNGYPAARRRLLRQLRDTQASNPVVLSGDIHAFLAGELQLDGGQPADAIVASELVATSITSQAPPDAVLQRIRGSNANIRYVNGEYRGYLRLDITRAALRADLMGVDTVRERRSAAKILRSFVLEDGVRGLVDA
jgi:alkaline phosphatase D